MRHVHAAGVIFAAGAVFLGASTLVGGAGQTAAPQATSPAAARPDFSRFTVNTIIPQGELDEPMAFSIASDGKVYIAERKGKVKLYSPSTGVTTVIATMPVNTKYTSAQGVEREAEEGLLGLILDKDFDKTRWVYMLYADPAAAQHSLARWQLSADDKLVDASKRVLLSYPAQRETCCHTGGGMTWDAAGNLYMTVGNNSGNSQFMQSDERPGRSSWDDQRGSANTNDLRGKIIRIHPEADGTYTIPAGNLFPPGTANTRPEIYTMGHRNPWRVSVDSRTGYIYWGEVGPDQQADSATGPRGYDELNQARRPGFFGWPYFIGENRGYRYADYVNDRFLDPKDPARPVNTSPNNTGMRELPPAQPSFIGYEYAASEKFPELGTGGRCAVGGPVYHRTDFKANAARRWPAYYEGKWIATDCDRGFVMVVTMNAQGDYQSMERLVLPGLTLTMPMDIKFGPEGDLYVVDYGTTPFAYSPGARLIRVEYESGNRRPTAVAASNVTGGALPLTVRLNGAASTDRDGGTLQYRWSVAPAGGGTARAFTGATPSVSFDRAGRYTATLTVSDPGGASSTDTVDIVAGNQPPAIKVNVENNVPGNNMFFAFGRPVRYAITATDVEDRAIDPSRLAVSVDYVPEGFDLSALRQGQEAVTNITRYAVAQNLMAQHGCRTCHQPEVMTVGPSMKDLAAKYPLNPDTLSNLSIKVRNGGNGVWTTERTMPPHPNVSTFEARTMIEYMLRATQPPAPALPLTGSYTPEIPSGDTGGGALVVRAVYTDAGANGVPALTSESMVVLRAPRLVVENAPVKDRIGPAVGRGSIGNMVARPGAYVAFRGVQLDGVTAIDFGAQGQAGTSLEVRLGSPTGTIIGRSENVPVAAGRGAGGGAAAAAQAGTQPAAQPAPAAPTGPVSANAGRAGGAGQAAPGQLVARGGGAGQPAAGAAPAAVGAPAQAPAPGAAAPGAVAANAPPAGAAGAAGRAGGAAAAAGAGRAGGGGGRGGGAPRASVTITPTTGTHDVYVVVANASARPTLDVVTLSDLRFVFGN